MPGLSVPIAKGGKRKRKAEIGRPRNGPRTGFGPRNPWPDFRFRGGSGIALLLSCRRLGAVGQGLKPVELRCEHIENPSGVDVPRPHSFWTMESPARNRWQPVWQVLAARSLRLMSPGHADLWDSGKVVSADNTQVPCAGKALKSSPAIYGQVRVWDREGRVSPWSKLGCWTMGVMAASDWQAKWISSGAARNFHHRQTRLLLRECTVKPGLERAGVPVGGLGQEHLRFAVASWLRRQALRSRRPERTSIVK